MINLRLTDVLQLTGAQLHGGLPAEFELRGMFTDTRQPVVGGVFVALRGPRFDAHDFLEHAKQGGAALAVVERLMPVDVPQIVVGDTYLALGCLAAGWRTQWPGRMVALTGSNGKTSTKEMLASILQQRAPTLATQGNLNNEVGVPLTLARLGAHHAFAVIEMGANHRGELAYLSSLARPDVALVTNTGRAHIEGFGGEYGVVRGKGEIFAGLRAGGVALVNLDDKSAAYFQAINHGRTQTYALHANADVQGSWQASMQGGQLSLRTALAEVDIPLQVAGEHNGRNALAAASAALALGLSLEEIERGLGSYQGMRGRLQRKTGLRGIELWDDTYNANPDSLQAGMRTVLSMAQGRPVWLLLGNMGELGDDAPALHAQAGALARELGVARLLAVGDLAAHAAHTFGAAGEHFSTQEALLAHVAPQLAADVVILVKGSRSARMENVVQALLAEHSSC